MIVESHRHVIADCQCPCRRVGVPCVELSASERDEGLGSSVVSMRLDLRVVIGVECLRGMLTPRSSTARHRWADLPSTRAALPVVPATCGECAHRSPENANGDALCGKLSSRFHEGLVGASHAPPDECPLRKGAV